MEITGCGVDYSLPKARGVTPATTLLDAGRMEVRLLKKGGMKMMTHRHGDYFGELSSLSSLPRASRVAASDAEGCVCLALPRFAFERLLSSVIDVLKRKADLYVKYEDAIEAAVLDEGSNNNDTTNTTPARSDDDDDNTPSVSMIRVTVSAITAMVIVTKARQ